jgi:hypothetical protein
VVVDIQQASDEPPAPGPDQAAEQTVDRRRPGRIENVPPSLIPLLRGEQRPLVDDTSPAYDSLDAARGILAAVVMSAVLWGLIALVGLVVEWLV